MPATIRDVARASGVHVSTVSRTFSAPSLVNPETRHRSIMYLGGPRGSWTNRELRRAATATARSADVELTVLGPVAPTEAGGAAVADQIRRGPASAVLAYNDLMAIGLLEALRARNVDVPGELSIVGVDDIPLSALVKLTTVSTPTADAGRVAVDLLLQPRDRRTSAPVILPTALTCRASAGPYVP